MRAIYQALVLAAATLAAGAATAQAYPTKPVRVIVPFAPGGGTDIVARIVSARLSERMGQQFVVDNRPGAAGSVGTELTVRAAPDGHTLLVGSTSEIGISPSLYAKLPYDVLRDLTPAAAIAACPMVLVVHPALPVKTAKELVHLAHSRPGQLNYGSAGAGTGNHMSAEFFRHLTKTQIVHISYKGAAPALADVIGGQVHMMFSTLPAALGLMKAGRLKALGVAARERSPFAPDVPTMAESGVPGYEVDYWYGFFTPAAASKDVLARIHAETGNVLRMPETVASLAAQGLVPTIRTPAEFAAFVRADIERWAVVVKASGAKPD